MSDFSLVKMVYKIAKEHRREPRWPEIEQAIRRNFGGLDEIDPVKIFRKFFPFSRNDKVGVLKNLVVLHLPAKLPPYFTTRWLVHSSPSRLSWTGILCANRQAEFSVTSVSNQPSFLIS